MFLSTSITDQKAQSLCDSLNCWRHVPTAINEHYPVRNPWRFVFVITLLCLAYALILFNECHAVFNESACGLFLFSKDNLYVLGKQGFPYIYDNKVWITQRFVSCGDRTQNILYRRNLRDFRFNHYGCATHTLIIITPRGVNGLT